METQIKKRLESMNNLEQQTLKDMWKAFGMETAEGKKLYAMYNNNKNNKKLINYPKVKTKTKKQKQEEKDKENLNKNKKCPQKTLIDYPPLKIQCTTKKVHKIDLIPKRKKKDVIKEEIQLQKIYQQKPELIDGQDRQKMIQDLQEMNLQKGVGKNVELTEQEYKKLNLKIAAKLQVFQNKYMFHKKQIEIENQVLSEADQLNEIFDDIMQNVKQKQQMYDNINDSKNKKLKSSLKQEIIQGIKQLEQITKKLKKINSTKNELQDQN